MTKENWTLIHDIELNSNVDADGFHVQIFKSSKGRTYSWHVISSRDNWTLTCPVKYATDAHALRDALCFIGGIPRKAYFDRIIGGCNYTDM